MNIEKVYTALCKDEMNSSLGIICAELESQGYQAEIEGIRVISEEIFANKFPSLEEIGDPLNIKLFKHGSVEQKFSIKFVEYHQIVFQEYLK